MWHLWVILYGLKEKSLNGSGACVLMATWVQIQTLSPSVSNELAKRCNDKEPGPAAETRNGMGLLLKRVDHGAAALTSSWAATLAQGPQYRLSLQTGKLHSGCTAMAPRSNM